MQTTVEAIASKLVDHFNIEMDIYQVSENSMEALNLMGMLKIGKRAIAGRAVNQQARMPVDCVDVKAVYRLPNTTPTLANSVTLTIQDIAFPPQTFFVPVPNSDSEVEAVELPDQILNYIPHIVGPYIDFEWDPPFLKFNEIEPQFIAIYNRIPINPKTCLAEIPEDAFLGCLNYCVFVWFRPLFLTGKIPKHVWDEIKEWKRSKMAQSESKYMMSQLSQNEMSKVHSVMSSFDRKRTRIDS